MLMEFMDLSLVALRSILEPFTNQFQVTGDIKQVFSIRMKFMEDAFFANSKLQVYKHTRIKD